MATRKWARTLFLIWLSASEKEKKDAPERSLIFSECACFVILLDSARDHQVVAAIFMLHFKLHTYHHPTDPISSRFSELTSSTSLYPLVSSSSSFSTRLYKLFVAIVTWESQRLCILNIFFSLLTDYFWHTISLLLKLFIALCIVSWLPALSS